MIEDVKILNGTLDLKFDKYTYNYTVSVDKDVESLEFSYKLKEDTYVEILDNVLDDKENIVKLNVYNVNEEVTYTFYVYKETMEVNGLNDYMESLKVEVKEPTYFYKVEILAVSIFLVIVIIFSLLFHRKSS